MHPHNGANGTRKSSDVFGDLLSGTFTAASQNKPLNALRAGGTPSNSWSSAPPANEASVWDFDALDNATARRSMSTNVSIAHRDGGHGLWPPSTAMATPGPTAVSPAPPGASLIDFDPLEQLHAAPRTSSGQGAPVVPPGRSQTGPDPWDFDFLSDSKPIALSPNGKDNPVVSSFTTSPIPAISVQEPAPGHETGWASFPNGGTDRPSTDFDSLKSSPKTISNDYSWNWNTGSSDQSSSGDIASGVYNRMKSARGTMQLAGSLVGFGQQLLTKAATNAAKVFTNASTKTSFLPSVTESARFRDSSDEESEEPVIGRSTSGLNSGGKEPPRSGQVTPERKAPSVDAETLAKSEILRKEGNELFKAGDYSAAIGRYSDAIAVLPLGAPQLLALYNNRAAASLKVGDYTTCVADCDEAQKLFNGDQKSLLRRATAFEGLEKWDNALKDYQQLLSAHPGLVTASQGSARCRQAQSITRKGWTPPRKVPANTSEPTIGAPPAARMDADLSAIFDPHFPAAPSATSRSARGSPGGDLFLPVHELRLGDKMALGEDSAQLDLKDVVDRKVAAWLSKRETNIRALLASVEQVVWPELGIKNSPLSDLVNPAQVKRHYLKAITRTHPDKVRTTTDISFRLLRLTFCLSFLSLRFIPMRPRNIK